MSLSIFKATQQHSQYFKKEVIENGVGYIVSDKTAIAGMFSFMIEGNKATLNFPYCINKEAIKLAFTTFLENFPDVIEVKCLSRQKLDDLGFKNQVYHRG